MALNPELNKLIHTCAIMGAATEKLYETIANKEGPKVAAMIGNRETEVTKQKRDFSGLYAVVKKWVEENG